MPSPYLSLPVAQASPDLNAEIAAKEAALSDPNVNWPMLSTGGISIVGLNVDGTLIVIGGSSTSTSGTTGSTELTPDAEARLQAAESVVMQLQTQVSSVAENAAIKNGEFDKWQNKPTPMSLKK